MDTRGYEMLHGRDKERLLKVILSSLEGCEITWVPAFNYVRSRFRTGDEFNSFRVARITLDTGEVLECSYPSESGHPPPWAEDIMGGEIGYPPKKEEVQ